MPPNLKHEFDPIGPGTPAWEQFDKALIAYARAEHHHQSDCNYKAYSNHRQRMITRLRAAHTSEDTIHQWCQHLLRTAKSGDMGSDGEWIK